MTGKDGAGEAHPDRAPRLKRDDNQRDGVQKRSADVIGSPENTTYRERLQEQCLFSLEGGEM